MPPSPLAPATKVISVPGQTPSRQRVRDSSQAPGIPRASPRLTTGTGSPPLLLPVPLPPPLLFCQACCERTSSQYPSPQPQVLAQSGHRAKEKFSEFLSISGCTVFPAIFPTPPPQPALLPQKVGKVKNETAPVGLPMNGPADLPRASQKQGPAALTGGLRPLPLPLQPKTGRLPGGATAAWELIGCPTQGHRSLPCLVCELPLVNFSWQGRPSRPHLPNPSPCPQLAAPHARKGGTNSNCLLQKKSL